MRSTLARSRRFALCVLCAIAVMGVVVNAPASALPNTSSPTLRLARTIRTTPFTGTNLSMRDGEGSAFVPNNAAHSNRDGTDSLWLAEDNGHSVWEVNPYTGVLKSHLGSTEWAATRQYSSATGTGSGALASSQNYADIESMAYDRVADTLYVFSGKCCSSSVRPSVFRLKRGGDGSFYPESWQPLASGSDFTAAAWHPVDGKLYVGVGSDLRTYDYRTNTPGSIFHVSSLSGIFGMSFSDDGAELFVATSSVKLVVVTWGTKTIKSGWSFDLKPFNVKDSRAVELIKDQFYVLDGYDSRSSGDPLKYAVFVFDVCCGSSAVPTAAFTASQLSSPPLTVQFTDTSTGSPTGWSWNFGDGSTSTSQSPTHTYAASGSYSVTLVASNGSGSSAPVSHTVNVGDGSQMVFAAIADGYVVEASPDTNYGTAANLHVKTSSSNEKRAYFKFSLSGLQGKTVTSAKLRLYVTDPSSTGGSAHAVSSNWIESGAGGLTWNNQPVITGPEPVSYHI
jgi:PKD repeat protein